LQQVLDAEDIIRSGFNSSIVEIDRRVLDFLIGLDTELSEIVDGSHLYNPTTDIEDVIIPAEMKKSVLDIVQNYEVYKKAISILEIDKKLSYGLGITLLFSGDSGTGKTALANSIGKLLKKKILLVNFPNLGMATLTCFLIDLPNDALLLRCKLSWLLRENDFP